MEKVRAPARTGRAGPDPLHARVHAPLVHLIVFDASSHVTAARRKYASLAM